MCHNLLCMSINTRSAIKCVQNYFEYTNMAPSKVIYFVIEENAHNVHCHNTIIKFFHNNSYIFLRKIIKIQT